MNKEDADLALFTFADVADELELDWFLFAGTCLGLHRDGKYLPGDNDLDVGVLAEPQDLAELWDTLNRKGFSLGQFNRNRDGTQNRHVYHGINGSWPKADDPEVMVDVWFTFTDDEHNLLVNFGQITYEDRSFLVPYPVGVYLQLAYEEWWDKDDRRSAIGKENVLHAIA